MKCAGEGACRTVLPKERAVSEEKAGERVQYFGAQRKDLAVKGDFWAKRGMNGPGSAMEGVCGKLGEGQRWSWDLQKGARVLNEGEKDKTPVLFAKSTGEGF